MTPNPSSIAMEDEWGDPRKGPCECDLDMRPKVSCYHCSGPVDLSDVPDALVEDVELVDRFRVTVVEDGVLTSMAKEFHALAREKGFWSHEILAGSIINPSIVPEKLALLSSEVGEILEGWRDDDPVNMEEEMADVLIRLLDLAEFLGFNLDRAVARKHEKNTGRPYLHGRVR